MDEISPIAKIEQVLDGTLCRSCLGKPGSVGVRPLFPGSFNPLHCGHYEMAKFATERTGIATEFEISICNVDKRDSTADQILERSAQFSVDQTLWITRAATFVEKAKLFPNSLMLVGLDTMMRVAHKKYYQNEHVLRDRAIQEIAHQNCRFIVFGRLTSIGYQTLNDIEIPKELRNICETLSEREFRCDMSSTQLRGGS